MTYDAIVQQVQAGNFAPVYYFYGDEHWFTDKLTHLVEVHALAPDEEAFNKQVFYGAEAKAAAVLGACRSFPMLAHRRLVVVKEAHRMDKNEIEKLLPYFKQPVASSVLLLSFKGEKKSLPAAAAKAIEANAGVLHEAKKMYERDAKAWLDQLIRRRNISADPDVADLMLANLGVNLGLLENELDKMAIALQASGQPRLTRGFVLDSIGLDREFNVFELINALSTRQTQKCHMMIAQMTRNLKLNPPVVVAGGLYRFYHQIALAYSHKLTDAKSIQNQLKINWFQATDTANGKRSYNLSQVYRNIGFIEEADKQLKGITPSLMDEQHILKTLVWQLLLP